MKNDVWFHRNLMKTVARCVPYSQLCPSSGPPDKGQQHALDNYFYW